jgi:hypothetical protein
MAFTNKAVVNTVRFINEWVPYKEEQLAHSEATGGAYRHPVPIRIADSCMSSLPFSGEHSHTQKKLCAGQAIGALRYLRV